MKYKNVSNTLNYFKKGINQFIFRKILIILSTILAISSAQFKWSMNPNNRGGLDLGGRYSHDFNKNLQGEAFGQGSLNPGNSIRLSDRTYGAGATYMGMPENLI